MPAERGGMLPAHAEGPCDGSGIAWSATRVADGISLTVTGPNFKVLYTLPANLLRKTGNDEKYDGPHHFEMAPARI